MYPKRFHLGGALSLLILAMLILSISISGFTVRAISGNIDQQCSTVGGGYLNGIGAYEPTGQTFAPSQTSIVGFAIYIRSLNGAPTPMTARILSGGKGGTPIGSVNFDVPAGFNGGNYDWLAVQFTGGIQVTPGATYALDLTDNLASSGILWNTCADNYPGGTGYSSGSYGVSDYMFQEYSGDFAIGLAVTTFSTPQGTPASTTDSVTVTSVSGFNSPVSLSVSGAPAGVSTSFSTNPVTPPSGSSVSSVLTISVSGSVLAGSYAITIAGSSGPTSHSTAFALTVTPVATPDFSLSSTPGTLGISQGGGGSSTITVTSLNGFNSAVDLGASWVGSAPSNVVFSLPTPVTPPSGSTATSSLTVAASLTASTGTFTLRVTGSSGSLSHYVDVPVQVSPAATSTTVATTSTTVSTTVVPPPDFSINSSPASLSVASGATGTFTIIVGSLYGFSSPVSLSYSWVGTAPSGVSITLPGPITPPSGSTATSTLTVSTSTGASTGSFTLAVTGSSGSLTHAVNVGVAIGAKCLIATATYGSEVAPEVQLLRNFRDNSLMRTQAGSSFMIAFNTWYYSFSPSVATYVSGHSAERTVMKGVLYPLIGIMYVTSGIFSSTSSMPELATLLSGLFASCLIGAVYLGLPLTLIRIKIRRLRGVRSQQSFVRVLGVTLLVALGILVVGEFFASSLLLVVATSSIALSVLFLSAAITSSIISKRLNRI